MAKKKRGGGRQGGQSRRRTNEPVSSEDRDDRLEMEGEVLQALPSAYFKIGCDNGMEVLATLSGKIRKNRIRILPGDRVVIEVSPYDPTRGRITWRHRS